MRKQALSIVVLGLAVSLGPAALLVVLQALTADNPSAGVRVERILWGAVAFGLAIVVAGVVKYVKAPAT